MLTNRCARLAGLVAGVALGASLVATAPQAQAGPNLLPNASFEQSVIEGSVIGDSPIHGVSPQGVLPTHWAFEGAAGLFDHGNGGTSGARMAAISIPLGTKSSICGPEVGCNPNPAAGVKDTGDAAYSVDPAWRPAAPVLVSGGASYTVSAKTAVEFATDGEGAFVKVRWLGVGGTVIGISDEYSVRPPGGYTSGAGGAFVDIGGPVTAPAGAVAAVPLFGATDDLWLTKVMFDDVFFG